MDFPSPGTSTYASAYTTVGHGLRSRDSGSFGQDPESPGTTRYDDRDSSKDRRTSADKSKLACIAAIACVALLALVFAVGGMGDGSDLGASTDDSRAIPPVPPAMPTQKRPIQPPPPPPQKVAPVPPVVPPPVPTEQSKPGVPDPARGSSKAEKGVTIKNLDEKQKKDQQQDPPAKAD
eukprot:COSAG05_NODE_7069_length_860_cov_1.080158_1_plen_177_part_10